MGKYNGWTIISDYDGTLTAGSGLVAPENIAAINEFMENGGRFGMATGRFKVEMDFYLKEAFRPNAPGLFYNGALIQEPDTGKVLYSRPLPSGFMKLLDRCLEHFPNLNVWICRKNDCINFQEIPFSEQLQEEYRQELHIEKPVPEEEMRMILGMNQPWLVKSPEYIEEKECYKILLWGLRKDIEELWKYLKCQEEISDYQMVSSLTTNLEITAAGVDKGTSLSWLLRHQDLGNVLVLGDGENDRSMFEVSEHSGAPFCAKESLKNMASFVCLNDEGMVPAALHYINQNIK